MKPAYQGCRPGSGLHEVVIIAVEVDQGFAVVPHSLNYFADQNHMVSCLDFVSDGTFKGADRAGQ
jgi:hypothetical protein